MARNGNQLLGAILLAIVLLVLNLTTAIARTWTLSELDTLSDRKWHWVDEKYKQSNPAEFGPGAAPTQLPTKYRDSRPVYPATAAGQEGTVWLRVFIDKKGIVREALVLEDSGVRVGFEEAALEAARKTQWKPAFLDRDRIAVWVKYEVAFYQRVTKWNDPIQLLEPWNWEVKVPNVFADAQYESPSTRAADDPDIDEFVMIEERPILSKSVAAIYPSSEQAHRMGGSVWIKVLVNRDGRVSRAVVMTKSGCECGFEESALTSAVNSEWKPAKQDGVPISLWVSYEVKFQPLRR